jgi:eukaryotic-like serine/threonine-protein kinase
MREYGQCDFPLRRGSVWCRDRSCGGRRRRPEFFIVAIAESNFLFGLLALQTGMIDQAAIVAAFHEWTRDKTRSMAEILVGRGAIDAGDRAALEALAAKHLMRHGGDVEKSVAAVPAPRSVVTGFTGMRTSDADADAFLGLLSAGLGGTELDNGVSDATATTSVGGAVGDGERFRILRPHAKGGLGAVFVALDAELHREVALKQILDSHADDPDSQTRFVLEAEITGGLEHPGIVPVYGLGTYDGGRPYYAMRFIQGDSLKETIERFHTDESLKQGPGRGSLELRKLLGRFLDVCNAIGYAHSRGVLHRDIKPANVIVGNHGETLVVDWGLAKIIGRSEPSALERSLRPSVNIGSADTLPGSALGTPAYMSPEQAGGQLERLGPRSDVYSLGATLYCLLTGRPPFAGDAGQVLRAAQKGEFPPPRHLDPAIDKALEVVCLKAMALQPEDRYESTKALADDVERWLADESVTAWREPLGRHVRRWARHNRTLVTATAVAVLFATTGLAAVVAVQNRANHTLQDVNASLTAANERESQANTDLRAANAEVLRQSHIARRNFLKARQAVDDSFTRISESTLLKFPLPGLQPLRKELLESALRYYQGFLGEAGDDPAVRSELAAAYLRAGSINAEIGSLQAALKQLDAARDLYVELARADPTDRSLRTALAESDQKAGLGLFDQDRFTECIPRFRQAIGLQEALAREAPGDTRMLTSLALSHNKLGAALFMVHRHDEFDRHLLSSARLRERLVALEPGNARFRADLAMIRNNLALVRESLGEVEGIAEAFQQARADLERVVAEQPDNPSFRADLGLVCCNQGRCLADLGRMPEALEALARSQAVCGQLVRENPTVNLFRNRLVFSSRFGAKWLNAAGRPDDALGAVGPTREILDADLAKDRSRIDRRTDLGAILLHTGDALSRKGQPGPALESVNHAVAILEAAISDIDEPLFQYDLACAYSLKCGLIGRAPDSASHQREMSRAGDLAVERLRWLVAKGYRTRHWFANDPQLDAIRGRADFQRLMEDLGMPADPFAR